MDLIWNYTERLIGNNPNKDVVVHYFREILPNRIVVLQADSQEQVQFKTRFNYSKWIGRNYRDVSELVLSEPRELRATMYDELRGNLAAFDPDSRSDLQRIFEKTPSKALLRTIAA